MSFFSGKRFLITGASGGVGGAIARRLGQEGAMLCLSGRNRDKLDKVANELPPGTGRCYPADLTREDELHDLVREVLAESGRLDGLIHAAAMFMLESLATASLEDFSHQFQINVLAPFLLTQLVLPALIDAQGQVIFINSSAGRKGHAGVGQYAATKHALVALADTFREECNSAGVRVCSLYLGSTATPMQAAVRAQEKRPYDPEKLIQPDDVAQLIVTVLALPHTAEVTDVTVRPTVKS